MVVLSDWRCGEEEIVAVDFLGTLRLVIAATEGCSVNVWTEFGQHVGILGSSGLWTLHPKQDKAMAERSRDAVRQQRLLQEKKRMKALHEGQVAAARERQEQMDRDDELQLALLRLRRNVGNKSELKRTSDRGRGDINWTALGVSSVAHIPEKLSTFVHHPTHGLL